MPDIPVARGAQPFAQPSQIWRPFMQASMGHDPLGLAAHASAAGARLESTVALSRSLFDVATMQFRQISANYGGAPARFGASFAQLALAGAAASATLGAQWAEYATDAFQRGVLAFDALREVGNHVLAAQPGEGTPALVYDYEMVIDGRTLERPVNYALVGILPPDGTTVNPLLRPYMIIDPRAGHGAGIGGFKSDSQVGVALAHGHAVYFVIFFPRPEPRQTLADVTAAEGRFFREIAMRHPAAPRPVVVGNCQGGWAAMLLAASNPHVTGPVVANGAPLSYWAGMHGKHPMRYLGGLHGGAAPVLFAADLGRGIFDGANLVLNFETMNPGNTWWRKYIDLYAKVDTEAARFISFEAWWSSYYLMNESEIRWIVENLFIGNKLQRGEAQLGGRTPIDLRRIQAPIIVFASQGDDITPPQQALGWIARLYEDEREIAARGQRIVYMVHPEIGHLGIFVSAKVARKEHDRIVTTLEEIEALAPGLYEMSIEGKAGEGIAAAYVVGFHARTMQDLRAVAGDDADEVAFTRVARASELGVAAYEMFGRPWVRAAVTPASADFMRQAHPLRLRRTLLSDLNPAARALGALAPGIRAHRAPAAPGNLFVQAERTWAAMVEQGFDFWRDLRAAADELGFLATWGNPFLAPLGDPRGEQPNAGVGETLRELPQVQAALGNLGRGGFAEAVVRMLILLAKARGSVRDVRLERSNAIMHGTEPFRSLDDAGRGRLIGEQALIVDFEVDGAVQTLPTLLTDEAERRRAIALVQEVAGSISEMNKRTLAMLNRIRATLGLAGLQA